VPSRRPAHRDRGVRRRARARPPTHEVLEPHRGSQPGPV
jgi:hypothetical protein